MENNCGIYKITNPKGKIYIGQSVCISERLQRYRTGKCHHQKKLFNSINKYGWDAHEFHVIHPCQPPELNDLEKYYVDLFQSFDSAHGLNLIEGGGSTGKRSEETKQRQRDYYVAHPELKLIYQQRAQHSIVEYCKKHGVWNRGIPRKYIPRPNGNKGGNNRAAKLTDNQVKQIRVMFDQKPLPLYTHIATLYNVSRTAISAIVNKKQWVHI